jgi:cytochrome c biogenesis protein CcmG/thiol:disulfide interchange protein DsbE
MNKFQLKNFVFILPIVVVIICVSLLYAKIDRRFGAANNAQDDYYKSALIGKQLPELNGIELYTKKAVTNTDIEGKFALVNVFASWCFTCLEEHKLFKAMKKNGMVFVGINWRDPEHDAKNWLEKHGNPYDIIVFDDKGKYGIDLAIRGVPETFFVSPEGKVLLHIRGNVTADFLEKIAKKM